MTETLTDPPPADLSALVEVLHRATRPQPLLLVADEAAAYCGFSRAALFRIKAAGELQAVDVPSVGPMYRRRDLDKFVDKLRPARRTRRVRAAAATAP